MYVGQIQNKFQHEPTLRCGDWEKGRIYLPNVTVVWKSLGIPRDVPGEGDTGWESAALLGTFPNVVVCLFLIS